MAGPEPVPPIQPPAWAIALCERLRGVAHQIAQAIWGTGGPGAPGSDGNPLTMEQARALFGEMAANEGIPHEYVRNYCFARAHEMRRLMAEKGVECKKVFNLATIFKDVKVNHPSMGEVTWWYHVAPTVAVQTPDGPARMVIDPALFMEPVTIAQWQAAQDCPKSQLEETDGRVYQPWDTYDDDYSETRKALEEAIVSRDTWRDGAVPLEEDLIDDPANDAADEAWEEGLVPAEEDEEDEQDVERSA